MQIWNQTYDAFKPDPIKGTQLPPGIYHIIAELKIDWPYYYGIRFPDRHFGKETTITIEE